MQIKNERPPNWDKILAVIPSVVDYPNAIFCYGDTIYNPGGKPLIPERIDHERIHSIEQLAVGVEWWWDRYLEDKEFRFNEEVPAYRAEYKAYCKNHANRDMQFKFLQQLAAQLAAEPYGARVSVAAAGRIIKYGPTNVNGY